MSTLSPITSDTTPLNNGTIVIRNSDSIIPSFDDNNNDFSQNYCCDLPADCEPYKEISEFQYGIYIYPLRKKILGLLSKTEDDENPFLFSASDLPNILGKGKTPEEAIESWEKDFHLKFRDIYYKQHWERNEEEQKLYEIFIDVIDIDEHKQRTPIRVKQTGKIINIFVDNKREIEWIDESRDIVDPAECPAELLRYQVGEYFRADTLRKYGTYKLVKICSITATKYREYSEDEINEFFDSLPVISLPPSKYWK